MRHRKLQAAVALAVVLAAGAAFAAAGGVTLANKPGLGSYLADEGGKTLYWFKKDAPGKSACSGKCVENWPLFYREKAAPPAGVEAKDFGTLAREDGAKQTTFRGYPLYYFAGDQKAGDTSGQGMGANWFVIDPAAFPPGSATTPSAPAAAPGKPW